MPMPCKSIYAIHGIIQLEANTSLHMYEKSNCFEKKTPTFLWFSMREINEKKTMVRMTCVGSTKLIYKAQL